jgi:hypothetical protein
LEVGPALGLVVPDVVLVPDVDGMPCLMHTTPSCARS